MNSLKKYHEVQKNVTNISSQTITDLYVQTWINIHRPTFSINCLEFRNLILFNFSFGTITFRADTFSGQTSLFYTPSIAIQGQSCLELYCWFFILQTGSLSGFLFMWNPLQILRCIISKNRCDWKWDIRLEEKTKIRETKFRLNWFLQLNFLMIEEFGWVMFIYT